MSDFLSLPVFAFAAGAAIGDHGSVRMKIPFSLRGLAVCAGLITLAAATD